MKPKRTDSINTKQKKTENIIFHKVLEIVGIERLSKNSRERRGQRMRLQEMSHIRKRKAKKNQRSV